MTTITDSPLLGGQQYPLLKGLEWRIETTPLGNKKTTRHLMSHLDGIGFRIVKDSKVVDLYVDGVSNADDLLRKLKLEVSLKKGRFVMSKRWSRVFRPYFFWLLKPQHKVSIEYHPEWTMPEWDGAALISRKFLAQFIANTPPAKRLALKRALLECGRVELTVLSKRGEDKGHALVVDDLPCDIMLPCDTKQELRRTDELVFVGLNPVHSRDTMWLDVQSLINLYPFFPIPQLLQWLTEAGDAFLTDIQSGHYDRIFERLPLGADLDAWPIQSFLRRGGSSMHFSSVFKALANQHTKMVKSRSLDKLKVPIPGGRYYVFCDVVGNKHIAKGEMLLDPTTATAWVSREDWPELLKIWGGADQDDALWVVPFTDWDGSRKILAWRSPNQLYEYALLIPHKDCQWLDWPALDSRNLPTRKHPTTYLDLIPKGSFKDEPYTIGGMNDAIKAASQNIGMPGIHVNLQMVLKATTGELPAELPASMEAVIDAGQKSGLSLLEVKRWDINHTRAWFLKHNRVPHALQRRILGMLKRDQRDLIEDTSDHWFDVFVAGVQAHLHAYRKKRDVIAKTCFPPVEVLMAGKAYLQQAARLKEAYAQVIKAAIERGTALTDEDFQRARIASERVLREYPPADWTGILAGVMVRSYVIGDQGNNTSDGVAWQMGAKREDGTRLNGIVHVTLRMLEQVGVIGEVIDTVEGKTLYYADKRVPQGEALHIKQTWLTYCRYQHPEYATVAMGSIPKPVRDQYKALVEKRCNENFYVGQEYESGLVEDRMVVYNKGNLIGYVQQGMEHRVNGKIVVKFATAVDGNVLVVKEV